MPLTETDFAEAVGRYWAGRAAFDELAAAFDNLPEGTDDEPIERVLHSAFDRVAAVAEIIRAAKPTGHAAMRRILILTDYAALTDQPEPLVA